MPRFMRGIQPAAEPWMPRTSRGMTNKQKGLPGLPPPALDIFIIFGARIVDGRPSPALRRRVENAFALGGTRPETRYLVSGGYGPPSEADMMAELLIGRGVPPEHIARDTESRTTLATARASARLLAGRRDVRRIVACSSSYHLPRCVMLLRLVGLKAGRAAVPSDRAEAGTATWLFYCLREALAIPHNLLMFTLGR